MVATVRRGTGLRDGQTKDLSGGETDLRIVGNAEVGRRSSPASI